MRRIKGAFKVWERGSRFLLKLLTMWAGGWGQETKLFLYIVITFVQCVCPKLLIQCLKMAKNSEISLYLL